MMSVFMRSRFMIWKSAVTVSVRLGEVEMVGSEKEGVVIDGEDVLTGFTTT